MGIATDRDSLVRLARAGRVANLSIGLEEGFLRTDIDAGVVVCGVGILLAGVQALGVLDVCSANIKMPYDCFRAGICAFETDSVSVAAHLDELEHGWGAALAASNPISLEESAWGTEGEALGVRHLLFADLELLLDGAVAGVVDRHADVVSLALTNGHLLVLLASAARTADLFALFLEERIHRADVGTLIAANVLVYRAGLDAMGLSTIDCGHDLELCGAGFASCHAYVLSALAVSRYWESLVYPAFTYTLTDSAIQICIVWTDIDACISPFAEKLATLSLIVFAAHTSAFVTHWRRVVVVNNTTRPISGIICATSSNT